MSAGFLMNNLRLRVDGKCYHLAISGRGDPILLLHGFSGDNSNWDAARRALQRTHQVIALDILGHGASDTPASVSDYGMDRVARDIIDVLMQLALDRAHLLGYSMGGRLALYLALHYPDHFTSLILESASAGIAGESERQARRHRDKALADRIEAEGVEWFVDYWERLPLWATQARLGADVLAAQRQQRLQNGARGLANSLRGMGAGAQPNLWPLLPSLELPALLIAGERDQKFRRINQDLLGELTRAALSIIPDAGHNTHLEQPAAFERAVVSFLGRL